MRGHKVDFRPGWDCHGLPIETKARAANDFSLSDLEVRKLGKSEVCVLEGCYWERDSLSVQLVFLGILWHFISQAQQNVSQTDSLTPS